MKKAIVLASTHRLRTYNAFNVGDVVTLAHYIDEEFAQFINEGGLPQGLHVSQFRLIDEEETKGRDHELFRIAWNYRDGEELRNLADNSLDRYHGCEKMVLSMREAIAAGYTREQVLDMVAQIDVEEDDVR